MNRSRAGNFLQWLLRTLLAFVLLLSGAGKLIDGSAAQHVFELLVGEGSSPAVLGRPVVLVLSLVELALAALLIVSRNPRPVLAAVGTLVLLFSLALLSLPVRGIEVPTCGCFGALVPDGSLGVALLRNLGLVILIAAALLRAEARSTG